MNKVLIIIVALTIIFGAFVLFGNKKSEQKEVAPATESKQTISPSQIQEDNNATTVMLTDTGFTPKDLVIKMGTEVVWVNKSGKAATVDSSDHPTHKLNPFLNLGEFSDGSTIQVAFDEVGEYGYHNHYNASQGGTVTVE